MFAVFQAIGLSPPTEVGIGASLTGGLAEARADSEDQLASRRVRLARMAADDPARAAQEERIAESESDLAGLRQAEILIRGRGNNASTGASITGVGWIDQGILDKWKKNPGLMLYKLQANSYKFSWLLIPLSLPLCGCCSPGSAGAGLRPRDFRYLFDRVHVAAVRGRLAAGCVGRVPAIIVPLVTILPAGHLYHQLRGAYGLSRFSIVVTLFLQILLVLGTFQLVSRILLARMKDMQDANRVTCDLVNQDIVRMDNRFTRARNASGTMKIKKLWQPLGAGLHSRH